MKKIMSLIGSLIMLMGPVCADQIENEKSQQFSIMEVAQIVKALPKDLFEALGGEAGIQKLPKEFPFNEPLFTPPEGQQVTEARKQVMLSLQIEEVDFSGDHFVEDSSPEIKQLLEKKITLVSLVIIPKIREGQEMVILSFTDGWLFQLSGFDAEGHDFIDGGIYGLIHLGKDKLNQRLQPSSKKFLELFNKG